MTKADSDLSQIEQQKLRTASVPTIVQFVLTASIVIAGAFIAGLIVLTLAAPRLSETLQPGSVRSDGERGFVQGLSLKAPWPYVVPSHPDFILTSGETALLQDGIPIGVVDPSHSNVDRLGGGRYDLWQGTLWFSTLGPDPRDASHTFTFFVATRLAPDVVVIGRRCSVVLMMLLLAQFAWSAAPYLIGGIGRKDVPPPPIAARIGIVLAAMLKWCWHLRWNFRAPYFVVTVAVLMAWTYLAWREPMSFLFEPDSRGYIEPGLRLFDGQTIVGTSIRNLGYPLLAYLAVRLGSIADLVPLQFGMMAVALFCLSQNFARFVEALLTSVGLSQSRCPVIVTALAALAGSLYFLELFSHDAFVISIYSIMAEVPHLLALSIALLCFVQGWSTASRRNRIITLALATDVAFLSTVIKPSSLFAFFLCAASLAVVCALYRRYLRSKIVVLVLVLSTSFVYTIHRFDTLVTPSDNDFGAKTLFCNHLDVVDRHMESTTPERFRIKALIAHVFSLGPQGWLLQGYNGDQCSWDADFMAAVSAAARSEGQSVRDWQMHEFEAAVLTHPLTYAHHVARQAYSYMRNPLPDIEMHGVSDITDGDWAALAAYGPVRAMQRDEFQGTVENWLRLRAPYLDDDLQKILKVMASSFAVVAVASTLLGLRNVFRGDVHRDLGPERVLLAVGAFTTALPVLIALSHSFDVGRYLLGILPFTLLWWCLGIIYLGREVFRVVSALCLPWLGRVSTALLSFDARGVSIARTEPSDRLDLQHVTGKLHCRDT